MIILYFVLQPLIERSPADNQAAKNHTMQVSAPRGVRGLGRGGEKNDSMGGAVGMAFFINRAIHCKPREAS